MISGGAGGGAGGQTFVNKDWLEGGQYTWDIPEILKGKYALVTACGGGRRRRRPALITRVEVVVLAGIL